MKYFVINSEGTEPSVTLLHTSEEVRELIIDMLDNCGWTVDQMKADIRVIEGIERKFNIAVKETTVYLEGTEDIIQVKK